MAPAKAFVSGVPCDGLLLKTARWAIGNKKNLETRMYVARSISGNTPCETKPLAPCAAWKFLSSVVVPTCADVIKRRETTPVARSAKPKRKPRIPHAIRKSVKPRAQCRIDLVGIARLHERGLGKGPSDEGSDLYRAISG